MPRANTENKMLYIVICEYGKVYEHAEITKLVNIAAEYGTEQSIIHAIKNDDEYNDRLYKSLMTMLEAVKIALVRYNVKPTMYATD